MTPCLPNRYECGRRGGSELRNASASVEPVATNDQLGCIRVLIPGAHARAKRNETSTLRRLVIEFPRGVRAVGVGSDGDATWPEPLVARRRPLVPMKNASARAGLYAVQIAMIVHLGAVSTVERHWSRSGCAAGTFALEDRCTGKKSAGSHTAVRRANQSDAPSLIWITVVI